MPQKLKDAFVVAKLSYFNISLLSEIQDLRKTNEELDALIDQVRKDIGLDKIDSLVNQAPFLEHAYICLVWLREVVMETSGKVHRKEQHDFVNSTILPSVQSRFDFSDISKLNGPRKLSNNGDKLILIRNGISHSKVEITETEYLISDQNDKKESSPTTVKMSWPTLGQLCDAFLFAVNDYLYPR